MENTKKNIPTEKMLDILYTKAQNDLLDIIIQAIKEKKILSLAEMEKNLDDLKILINK